MRKTNKKLPRSPKRRSTRDAPAPRGIDYMPALDAVADLAVWAFDLATADVADWPEGKRRVQNARRAVLHHLRGRRSGTASVEDILFTAGLLARIFEAELRLGAPLVVTILDQLGLPTDMVPIVPRVQPSVATATRPTVPPCALANVVPLGPCRKAPAEQPSVSPLDFRNAA